MSDADQHLTRLEKERARKRAKRARESSVEVDRRKEKIENKVNVIELLSRRHNENSVLLLISSERLIVELSSQNLNDYSILQLVSSERLIVDLQNLKLNMLNVLLLFSSEMLIAELQNLTFNENND